MIEQEEFRAATAIMIRALILAAIVALVVSAAPVAWAGTSKTPPSQTNLDIGTAERLDMNARSTAKRRGAGKVANLGAANDVSHLSW